MLQIITIIWVTHVQKNFEIRTSIKHLLTNYQFFTKMPQIPQIHINRNFSYICNFLDQVLHPYKFHGRDMSGILFFISTSREPLKIRWVAWFCVFNFLFPSLKPAVGYPQTHIVYVLSLHVLVEVNTRAIIYYHSLCEIFISSCTCCEFAQTFIGCFGKVINFLP